MNAHSMLSDSLTVRWDAQLESLVIEHPDSANFPEPIVRIRSATLAPMSFADASAFIGERIVLLIPALRARYVDPATGFVRGVE